MRFTRRNQVIAGLAIVAAAMLLGWLKLFTAPQSPAPELVVERLLPREDPPSLRTEGEPALPLVESAAPQSTAVASLRGRVFDAVTKVPIKAFEIQFFRFNPYRAAGPRQFQSAEGRFEWRDLPPDEWTIAVSARGYQRLESPVSMPAGEFPREFMLPLRSGQLLNGRVFDQATGTGIAGAWLAFREARAERFGVNWRSRPKTTTRSDGTFELDGLPAGRVTLEVYAKEYARREIDLTIDERAGSALEIALSAGAAIAGRLTAQDGVTPVAGRLTLMNLDAGSSSTGSTEAGGAFAYKNLPSGRYRLIGRGNGGAVEREISLTGVERIDNLVLALRAAGTVRGSITGLSAQDLARVGVSIQREGSWDSSLTATPDERGDYVLAGVPDGSLQIIADVSMRQRQSRRIEMPAHGDVTVDFEFPRGSRLSGRVMRQGKPLAGVQVGLDAALTQELALYPVMASARGEYAFENLPDGEYRFIVLGYRGPSVQVRGDTLFDIDVPAAMSVGGTVTDASRDEPLSSVDIMVFAAQSKDQPNSILTQTNQFGRFAVGRFRAGDYIVTAYKEGYDMYRERISVGASNLDLPIKLREGKGVDVRLRAIDGAPPRDVVVMEMSAGVFAGRFRVRLDESGEGSLPSALEGSTLKFAIEGFDPIDIARWDGNAIDLRLQRTARATRQP